MDEKTTERTTGQTTAQRIIGARIREFREAAGLSQAELARRVYVSRQTGRRTGRLGARWRTCRASSFSARSWNDGRRAHRR